MQTSVKKQTNMSTSLLDKKETRIRRMFGDIAPRYDFLNHLLSLNIDRYWRWRTTRLVPPEGTAPILDLCTGTGVAALVAGRDFATTAFGCDLGERAALFAEFNRRLVLEVDHRVRNNLSGLLSLVGLMRQGTPDVGSFADAIAFPASPLCLTNMILCQTWHRTDLQFGSPKT